MNIQKFTQKSIDAVNQLEKVASDFGNQEIEQEHLLYALLHQDQSLIAQLVSKMGIDERLFDYDLTQSGLCWTVSEQSTSWRRG